ncbi:MAG: UDP-N-acetylmuramoyl-L-alanyl-D-glutamate--2,6-diaminopimelate ligase [Desulfobulbaceae bacterium]|nr:UDP-N-acetylmuramoyl-L-alanyl-D-glutamate--2,6-diaminopimelate ligase [Desulfobulbaceae bacterium]
MVVSEAGHSGKELTELLEGLEGQVTGDPVGIKITAITADSREAGPGVLFVAIAGLQVDGHDFVAQAEAKGCAVVIVEKGRGKDLAGVEQVVRVAVEDTRMALGEVAAAFYDHPARRLKMIAITGTNGKTTTSYLLEGVLVAAGGRPGVIGTVNYRYAGKEIPAPFTTPEPVQLQQLLWEMAEQQVSHVVMEVSSHALAQKRLQGVLFDVALFTNLSRDHLDFHGDMESYFNAKKLLFQTYLKKEAVAVIMHDEAEGDWGCRLTQDLAKSQAWQTGNRKIMTCGMSADTDVYPVSASSSLDGIEAELSLPNGQMQLRTQLVGDYNLKNMLGCLGVGTVLGLDAEKMRQGLEKFTGVPGRLERVGKIDPARPAVFVDYAHTPDALENVLTTLRGLTPNRLIVIFGCGGDRDRGKRPMMGEVAGRLADVVLVTSDNPRSENPEAILQDIEAGLTDLPKIQGEALLGGQELRGYDIISSRRKAIQIGVQGAVAGDVVLVSGKGHECYQLDRSGKKFFDDRVEARESLFANA